MMVIEVEVEVETQLWDQVGGLSQCMEIMLDTFLTSPISVERISGQEFFILPHFGGWGGGRVKEGF